MSCVGTKFLQSNEYILTKQKIFCSDASLNNELNGLLDQKANTKFLGITPAYSVYIYEWGKNGSWIFKPYDKEKIKKQRTEIRNRYDEKISTTANDKKVKTFKKRKVKKIDRFNKKINLGNQLMRWGDPLTVYDSVLTESSKEKIQKYLLSKGYFYVKTEVNTTILNQKLKTLKQTFTINLGKRAYIDSIQYYISDTSFLKLIKKHSNQYPLQKGVYDQESFTKERDFLYHLAVNNGYYEFSKKYISFQIDSITLGTDKLILRKNIDNPKGQNSHKIFYIDSVVFISNMASDNIQHQKIKDQATFIFEKNQYSTKVLNTKISINTGDIYNREEILKTQKRLSYLDNFKFININYDTTGKKFTTHILVSPLKKYQLSSETGFSVSQGIPGPFFNVNLKNRNTFQLLDIIQLKGSVKLEGLSGVTGESNVDYSRVQYTGEISLNLPQFIFPTGKIIQAKINNFDPNTRLSFRATFDNRIEEYNRRLIEADFSYTWQVQNRIKYLLTPLRVTAIKSDNTPTFRNFLDSLQSTGSTYGNSFRSSFISSINFQVDISSKNYYDKKKGDFLSLFSELGGDFNQIFGEKAFGDSLEHYRFTKLRIDYRKISRLSNGLDLAFKIKVGLAYPHGTNNSLPYEKYFFAGGSNSIRAWKPRRLGPGSFGILNNNNEINYQLEQPGELLIESSIELRKSLIGFIEGALFFDAGNVWLVRSSSVDSHLDSEEDDGKFRYESFINEIALGTGLGLRFNLSFLIFRLDWGVKMIDPAQLTGKRFVGNKIISDFYNQSELNIGIGYPF